MDSLRYWVLDMHVDGFRFDLAPVLARELYEVNRLGTFFDIIHQDPVLSQVKLIAEPWDVGPGGYQVGNFPVGWAEWNDRYRNCVRQLLERRSRPAARARVAALRLERPVRRRAGATRTRASTSSPRTTGSRWPTSSSYEHKHNDAERRGQPRRHQTTTTARTGASRGRPTSSGCISMRAQTRRNLMATLFLSQGVRMLVAGDEMGRTQRGNNNAYCQDNEISWVDWELDQTNRDLLEFTRTSDRDLPRRTRCCGTRASSRAGRSRATASRTSCGCAATAWR